MAAEHKHQWIETEAVHKVLSAVFSQSDYEMRRYRICALCLFIHAHIISTLSHEQVASKRRRKEA